MKKLTIVAALISFLLGAPASWSSQQELAGKLYGRQITLWFAATNVEIHLLQTANAVYLEVSDPTPQTRRSGAPR